ncbi:hypothetical protein ANN_24237 [Periplaneta americana]|uniref:Uncharacterized protein n=1 Tax=Periplaneta americana TaxID=6978 RepID=A0ABQ8S2V0_PERAM|nr:hypothetical protein ANN_24237 [Periplaneta americana]
MAGLCEGGNEPPGSLNARAKRLQTQSTESLSASMRVITPIVLHGARDLYHDVLGGHIAVCSGANLYGPVGPERTQ